MAIIEAEGLFSGERLSACSDLAQLYWPRFYIGSNGFGRLELSYTSIISKIFGKFRKPPESEVLWAIFREYEANFLAILYEINGVWWCEFDTSQKFLPRYKTRRDLDSPSPSLEMRQKFDKGYISWKSSKCFTPQSFQKSSESFGRRGEGVGVGDGVGDKTTTIARSVTPEELAGTLPLVGNKEYSVSKVQIAGWQKAFPGVNVRQEIIKFKEWCIANPEKKKTSRGIARSIFRWLDNAQNKSKPNGGSNGLTEFIAGLEADRSGHDGGLYDARGKEAGQDDLDALLLTPFERAN